MIQIYPLLPASSLRGALFLISIKAQNNAHFNFFTISNIHKIEIIGRAFGEISARKWNKRSLFVGWQTLQKRGNKFAEEGQI